MTTQEWVARVDLDEAATDQVVTSLLEALTGHSPSVGGESGSRLLSATISIDAGTLRQAIDLAVKTVTAAAASVGVASRLVGVEVITAAERERRIAEPNVPDLVGISDIAAMFSVTQQRASQLAARDDFPTAVAHPSAGKLFIRGQVEQFGQRWDRRGGRPRKAPEA